MYHAIYRTFVIARHDCVLVNSQQVDPVTLCHTVYIHQCIAMHVWVGWYC